MTSVSLIPAYRTDARKRRRRLRRWATAGAGYVLFLAVTYAFCNAIWGADGRSLASESQKTAAKIAETQRQLATLEKELLHDEQLLAANRTLADQPDWSLLLAALSQTLQDEVVLRSCQLKPVWVGPGSSRGTPLPPGSQSNAFLLALRGFGKSQAAVAQFVLRLEGTELFEEVKIIETRRESFRAAEAVAFQLDCLLRTGNGKTH